MSRRLCCRGRNQYSGGTGGKRSTEIQDGGGEEASGYDELELDERSLLSAKKVFKESYLRENLSGTMILETDRVKKQIKKKDFNQQFAQTNRKNVICNLPKQRNGKLYNDYRKKSGSPL